jgi:PAS domain S-box-containing protein
LTHITLTEQAARDFSASDPLRRSINAAQSAAAELRTELGARLSLAFDIQTVGVLFFDAASRIIDCNDAFLRMAGYSRDDFRSGAVRWDKVTPREWVETTADGSHVSSVSQRLEPWEREYVRPDGSRWWGLVAAQWLSPDEGVEFIIDVTDRRNAEQELAVAQRLLEAEAARKDLRRQLIRAEERQRKRLARDLHDRLGQHLTGFSLELRQARNEARDNPQLEDILARLAELAEVMTRDARELALELRPPELDDIGIASALETYLAQWTKRFGIVVDLEVAAIDARASSGEPATVIYRILQEAMTNVARHAGASTVSVILAQTDGYLNLIVEDDGAGFDADDITRRDPRDQRYGLAGMRERAEIAGGSVTVESAAGRGTTVFARIPLEESPA